MCRRYGCFRFYIRIGYAAVRGLSGERKLPFTPCSSKADSFLGTEFCWPNEQFRNRPYNVDFLFALTQTVEFLSRPEHLPNMRLAQPTQMQEPLA
jgi:hypothetical protein